MAGGDVFLAAECRPIALLRTHVSRALPHHPLTTQVKMAEVEEKKTDAPQPTKVRRRVATSRLGGRRSRGGMNKIRRLRSEAFADRTAALSSSPPPTIPPPPDSSSQEFPKKDAALAAGLSEKVVAKAFKEGGKKGVEIEGAADTSGLTCFCTRMLQSQGNIALLQASMEGMNSVPDPDDPEERKGCSGHIAKLIISENEQEKKIAMVAYVPEAMKDTINAIEWMKSVCDTELGGGVGGAPDDDSTDTWATCTAVEDTDKGFFFLKMKDNTLGAAIAFLREKGLFQDDESEDEGDNAAADFEW